MEKRNVMFRSDGLELVGDLHVPDGRGPFPAVVLTGPFSSVKEQVTGTYAVEFAQRGIAALAFDHRGWGGSAGLLRCHEDTAARVADLRAAVSFLAASPAVESERIGVCGICLGAVSAILFAAFDPRARALALIGGSYNQPAVLRERFGPAAYDGLLDRFAEISQWQYGTGEVEYWPAADPNAMEAGMPGPEPWSYYGTDRGARMTWENRCTALSVLEELTTTAAHALPMLIGTPLLVVHGRGDQAVPPDDARGAVAAAGGPAELVWVDSNDHVGLYDRPDVVGAATDAAVAFFREQL